MKQIITLISALLMASCANQTTSTPAIKLENLDSTYLVQDNFYDFATAGWQKLTPLRDEYASYGCFNVLRENNEIRINELFSTLSARKQTKGSVEQKIVDLYAMGQDSIRLNAEGFSPVKSQLEMIEKIDSREGISLMIAQLHSNVANPFFGCYVATDLKNSDRHIMYFSQSGLGMGTKDYYTEQRNQQTKEKYQEYIKELFTLAGYTAEQASKSAESVMKVENALAIAFSSNVELRDIQANYNMLSTEDFKATYDAIHWDTYATTLGIELPDSINLGQPRQMKEVNNLLKTLEIQTLKDYLAFNLLNSATSYVSDEIGESSFAFFGKVMSGQQERTPRWKRALGVPNGTLGEAVGQMYVKKYFPKEYKAKMLTLVENLQKALATHIDSLEWMSEVTKAKAQEKLSTITIKIGYPDKWKDYSTLEIDPSLSYWENIKAISAWNTAENFSRLEKPVDKDEWLMTPQTVNAYNNLQTNEICFPAAILQPPFFNPTADDAVNYGAIGVVIGHEMTHGFDDQGRQFDKDGNLNDWWAEADSEAFQKRADALAAQFDKVEVLPGIFANGKLTLGENIADQGGLRVAYTAMKQAQGGVEPAPIDGFSAEQRFYLAYATLWAQNIRDKEIERVTNTGVHSLGRNRVNQTLKNVDTFLEAFDITEGDMYIAPSERVVIW